MLAGICDGREDLPVVLTKPAEAVCIFSNDATTTPTRTPVVTLDEDAAYDAAYRAAVACYDNMIDFPPALEDVGDRLLECEALEP